MPLFNGFIVTKKLLNITDIFFGKPHKKKRHYLLGYFPLYHRYCDKMEEGILVIIARRSFKFKIIFLYKDGKKLD